ncbi:MAG: tryptophan--tRNA ligase [Azoarcus sp.]|nr:tryptophan--tRNA ligase [Azoarcus sp.]
MAQQRILTGITPSGAPHLGNYAGAIRPAVEASRQTGVESFYFLSDYHALVKTSSPERVRRATLEIAAAWLAAGLRPEKVWFYRQSDIPEIPELTWLLTCVTGKGLLNRAHAYKAAMDKNALDGADPDAGVTMGLFMYPLLMAADILMFKAHKVPVGRDQVQHLEMARDIAASFNHRYGEHFVLPEAAVDEAVATLPGLDGRKMSKSYDNTIPLFAPPAELKKLIFSIVTDSKAPGEPKETEGSPLFQLYRAFASPAEAQAMRARFEEGIAWGEAKAMLFDKLESVVAPMRARYEELIAEPERIEQVLKSGAERLRARYATPFIARLREAVGLRRLDRTLADEAQARPKPQARPQFKQYREADGLFYFKLVGADGRARLQSRGFASPREAGQAVADIEGGADFAPWADPAEGAGRDDIAQVLAALRAE